MVIFNEAKPKYEYLTMLLEDYINNIRYSNQVNIIVDLKDVLRKFFRPDIDDSSPKLRIQEISADVLNIIGHYRNYFYRKGKYTTFYFIYSFEKCEELLKIDPEYKKEYYEKYFNAEDPKHTIIKKSAQLIQKVIEYIPNCVFIESSNYDEFVYAKCLVEKIPDNEITIILSNNELFEQLIRKNIFMLTLKGIKSEFLTEKNVMQYLTGNENTILKTGLSPLFMAISGNKKLTIKSPTLVGKTRAEKILEHLINENKLENLIIDSIECPIEFSKLNEKNKLENILINNKELITKNYQLIRQDELLYKNKISIQLAFNQYTKKENSIFKLLNEKIFTMFPLQIEMMLKGEKI